MRVRGEVRDAPVQVVEEAEEVKSELEEALLFMASKRTEDLRRVVHVPIVPYSDTIASISARAYILRRAKGTYLLML